MWNAALQPILTYQENWPASLLKLLSPAWPLDAPLVRITTCGSPISIEVLQRVERGQPVYAPPDWKRLDNQTVLTLLAVLASQPGGIASQDFLSQVLRPSRRTPSLMEEDEDDDRCLKRPENLVTLLRRLLYPPALRHLREADQQTVRLHLVRRIKASRDSGPAYQLAPLPIIWLDVEAMEAHQRQIEHLEQIGGETQGAWQAISAIGLRGTFLPHEPYSDWAQWRRLRVRELLWQSVDAQLQAISQWEDQEAGYETALRLLSACWHMQLTNEDVFRALVKHLGKRERYQHAEECYHTLCKTLEQEGRDPQEQTRSVMKSMRARKPSVPTLLLEEHASLRSVATQPEERTLPDESASESSTTWLWHVPYLRNPFFTGREEMLAHLYETFHAGTGTIAVTQQALCGLGGIGKTQLALEYVYRYCRHYQAIFWIKADTRENLLAELLTLAGVLHLPEQSAQETAITLAAVKHWFQSHQDWLLVVDNADDLALVRAFLPTGAQGHILLTTRAQATGGLALSIQLDEMSQDVGALFLLRRAGLASPRANIDELATADYQLAQELVRELGGLPLALDQAGAYIEETGSSLQEYLDAYKAHRLSLLRRRGGLATDHPEPVATTWQLAFASIERTHPLAADILRLCAFLDPDAIPEELLVCAAPHRRSVPAEFDKYELNEAISVLLRYSLVRRNREAHALTLHRLVQAIIQETMEQPQQRDWTRIAICVLSKTFPAEISVDNWKQCQRLLPHAQLLISHDDWHGSAEVEMSTLCNQVGYYLREQALYREAEKCYHKGYALREKLFGPVHGETAQICYNLARLYFDTGQYKESIQWHQRALGIYEHALPSDELALARSLNSLAFTYYIQGIAPQETEQLFLRALPLYERAIGLEHPITSHCLSNLALFYASHSRFAEAEQLLRRVQYIREVHLPSLHLDTARSLQNLAWLFIHQGKSENYNEAQTLLERSLTIRINLLGKEHPQVAISLHNLALLYEARGQYREAEQLYQQVLVIRRKSLGSDNAKVILAESHYANLLQKMQRKEEAETLEKHIEAVQKAMSC